MVRSALATGGGCSAIAAAPRAAFVSAIGWVIGELITIWACGVIIGWIGLVLRSTVWLIVIGVLGFAYLAVMDPPDA